MSDGRAGELQRRLEALGADNTDDLRMFKMTRIAVEAIAALRDLEALERDALRWRKDDELHRLTFGNAHADERLKNVDAAILAARERT